MKNIEVLLKEKGYKFTRQRQIIWNVLLGNPGKLLSPKEICEIVRQKDNTLGIATVYRTLQIMDELGVIKSFDKKDEFNKYKLVIEEEGCIHPYLICTQCGKIIDIAGNLFISDPIIKIHNEYQFEVEDIRVKCYGVCDECVHKSLEKPV